MPSQGEIYQAYLAVTMHFSLNSNYDIRKSKGRLKNALNSPKAKNFIFRYIGDKVPSTGQAIALFVYVAVHSSSQNWLPNDALAILESDPELPRRLMHNLSKLDLLVRPGLEELSEDLSHNRIKISEWLGFDAFNYHKCALLEYTRCPELIISIIEALDMWEPLMVSYKDGLLQMNVRKLYRYRSFLGDDLLKKAVKEVHSHVDVTGLKKQITQILGKSQTKEKENNEWQALLMN